MPGSILIVDDVATNRIVLKVKLSTACYDVCARDSATNVLTEVRRVRPRLVILDYTGRECTALDSVRALRNNRETAALPVIVTGTPNAEMTAQSMARDALSAGADAFHPKPLNEALLLARIRNLLRTREISDELRLRGTTSQALGLAEAGSSFTRPARIGLVARDPAEALRWKHALAPHLSHRITVLSRASALKDSNPNVQDLYVIAATLDEPGDGLQLMSELRARRWSRHSAAVVLLPQSDPAMAAMALDLGAADVAELPLEGEGFALRVAQQLIRKHEADQLRRRVRDGLKLALTDPLTGLFNRRYALPHLARMRESALLKNQPFAVMVLDLDHFKRVNDTWGHASGDAVLCTVAGRIARNMRSVDLVARIGGEEFLIAMPNTTSEEAKAAALRLCRLIEADPIRLPDNNELHQTVSIGVAIGGTAPDATDAPDLPTEVLLDALIDRADQALMSSKAQGRNTVTLGKSAA